MKMIKDPKKIGLVTEDSFQDFFTRMSTYYKKSMKIVTYGLTLTPTNQKGRYIYNHTIKVLEDINQRGKAEIIVGFSDYSKISEKLKLLANYFKNIDFFFATECHAKMIIVDDRILYIGGINPLSSSGWDDVGILTINYLAKEAARKFKNIKKTSIKVKKEKEKRGIKCQPEL